MKKIKQCNNFVKILFFVFTCSMLFFSCKVDVDNNSNNQETESEDKNNENNTSSTNASYFWGSWQRMDNGQLYVVEEKSVFVYKSQSEKELIGTYDIVSEENGSSMTVESLGQFSKQSDKVMENNHIPYFRAGGTNLTYKMRLVGFVDSSRAASGINLGGYKVKGQSETYDSFSSDTTSEEDGSISLNAPVQGDTQTVTVEKGDEIIVVPGIKIENDNDYMGTIPIVEEGDYSFKITGTISEEEKDDGYLFGNNYKTYKLNLSITNISDVTSSTSICTIKSSDEKLSISSSENLDAILIPTMAGGLSKEIQIEVSYGILADPYIDTGVNVTIKNGTTGKEWVDYIPLRFYKGLMPITIAAVGTGKEDAALNGMIVYPDGKSQFISIPDNGYKSIYVPTFKNDSSYLLAFSGATVQGSLDASTEMYYTISVGTEEKIDVKTDKNSTASELIEYINYGENNNNEQNAYLATESFQAYLAAEDIDFYVVKTSDGQIVSPSKELLYDVEYNTIFGNAPEKKSLKNGSQLDESMLPELSKEHYIFNGWYAGNTKITSGYRLSSNLTLTAKWTPVNYSITYNLSGGTNNINNPRVYTVEDEVVFENPTKNGYEFDGWYTDSEFTNEITQIRTGSSGAITLYSKWTPINYTITYNLNGGTNNVNNPRVYTVENEVTFENPTKAGCVFDGWYTDSEFTNEITKIPIGTTGDFYIYAKWKNNTSVNVTVQQYSDITVTKKIDGSIITLTADEGFSSYSWTLDDKTCGSEKSITFDTSTWDSGVYQVFLLAQGTEGYRSASIVIEK